MTAQSGFGRLGKCANTNRLSQSLAGWKRAGCTVCRYRRDIGGGTAAFGKRTCGEDRGGDCTIGFGRRGKRRSRRGRRGSTSGAERSPRFGYRKRGKRTGGRVRGESRWSWECCRHGGIGCGMWSATETRSNCPKGMRKSDVNRWTLNSRALGRLGQSSCSFPCFW